jgi:hypothetical protein
MRLLKRLWAAPCSLVGLVFAMLALACGGRLRCHEGTLEATLDRHGRLARRCPFRAIALGHVIVAITAHDLNRSRAHERVHVRQYERWGLLFFPAYAASSLWQWVRGRRPYWDNAFEVDARARSES